MPTIAAEKLQTIAKRLLEGAGVSPDEAAIVARHSIGANLAGHDSHGIISIPTYIQRMKDGHIVPGAPFEIERESATTTVINGNWGLGYVVSERAMALTIEKARTQNVAATTIYQQSHVGRVADYTMMAAKEGFIGLMTCDSGRTKKNVVPFGGREKRLGTNPISIAMPSNLKGPFYIDISTAAAAAGKINVAISRGADVPLGWVVDKDGNPTNDPNQLKQGGALLPLGGSEGYKGYGLSAMVEILSALLPGLGFGVNPDGPHNDGSFMAAFKVDAFRDLETFKREVTEFAEYLTSTPPAKGYERVYYPGEIEHVRTQKALKDGIFVEDKTWDKLKGLAADYDMAEELGMGIA
ncbi:MAG: Ldh family oxidoreductase [Rhodospirillales bacterium]